MDMEFSDNKDTGMPKRKYNYKKKHQALLCSCGQVFVGTCIRANHLTSLNHHWFTNGGDEAGFQKLLGLKALIINKFKILWICNLSIDSIC